MTITVIITDGNNCFFETNVSNIDKANWIPNIECIIARTSGNIKNITICLNKVLLIICSSQPIFLKIIYLCLLSEFSVSCLSTKMEQLTIRKITPKYIAINTIKVGKPTLDSIIVGLVSPSNVFWALFNFWTKSESLLENIKSIFFFPSSLLTL